LKKNIVYSAASKCFADLVMNKGCTIMEVNFMVLGMVYKSMENVLGIKEAVNLDRKFRHSIGWIDDK